MWIPAEEVEPFYRVEVIVFQHVDGRPDAREVESPADFSHLLDPLQRARESRRTDAGDAEGRDEEISDAVELLETLAEIESGEMMPEMPTWPEPFLALEALSERMQDAWDRLERSGAHRPLTWRAWHQPLDSERSPRQVRLHDERLIDMDWLELTPAGIPALDGHDGADALMPDFYYRLDGGIRLRQRQFMHADIELHWRERAPSPSPLRMNSRSPRPDRLSVHRLEQSRTVRPGRLEYFDSSWLGVLLLIEELEPLDGSSVDEESRPEVPED